MEATGPYSAKLTLRINEETWPIEETITGFIVGVMAERSDDVPNMHHVDLEIFFPNNNSIKLSLIHI